MYTIFELKGLITLDNFSLSIDDIYQIVRKEILNLELAPGQMLSENILSGRFKVSRSPIRNVIERLRADKLITVVPKKGSFVSLIDLDMAEQIIFMRSRVELYAMAYLCKNPNVHILKRLKENIDSQRNLIDKDFTSQKFYEIDSEFHKICMEVVEKERVWKTIQEMEVDYSRYRLLDYISTSQVFETLHQEHVNIYKCIEAGDVDKISELLMKHLYGGILRIDSRLITDYKDYFVESNRSIEEIILYVKKIIVLNNF